MVVSNDSKAQLVCYLSAKYGLWISLNLNAYRRKGCGLLVFSLEMRFGLSMQPGEGLPTSAVSGTLLNIETPI